LQHSVSATIELFLLPAITKTDFKCKSNNLKFTITQIEYETS